MLALSFARRALALAFAPLLAAPLLLFACSGATSDPPSPSNNDDQQSDATTDTSPSPSANDGAPDSPDPVNDAGVDGDGAASKSDASTSQEKLICDALASRAACPGGAVACSASTKCIYGKVMLPAAAEAYASCRGAPSCKGDDFCVAKAGQAVGGTASMQYATDCVSRRAACSNSFDEDLCTPAAFAYPNLGAGAQTCLTKDCAQIQSCMEGLQAIKDIEACK
jgi:hypothetical protein